MGKTMQKGEETEETPREEVDQGQEDHQYPNQYPIPLPLWLNQ